MDFPVTREPTFSTTSTRSRCEWIFRNSRYVQDWNNVVERLLMEKSRKKKKRPKKKKVAPEPVVTQKEFELEIDHRERILEEHNEKFREMNEELDQQREKSAGALKLAYLLRLEIAKQKALIAEQNAAISVNESKVETLKIELQSDLKEKLAQMKKETESEITKIQEIFLRQQNDVKEMQEGTISEVRKTKNLLEQLESKTSDLIQLQKVSLKEGAPILLRLTDEDSDGWFYRGTIVSSEGDRYRVSMAGDRLVDVPESDIIKFQGSNQELKREDTVIAKHPNYQSTYAPGVVVKDMVNSSAYHIRFYDGTEGLLSKTEAHFVEHEKFENIVDYILKLEERWKGETIIARDDQTGIYRLATVKDRLGSGHEYLVEWNHDTSVKTIQHLSCIFGKYSKKKTLQINDHVISCPSSDELLYFPGVIKSIQGGKVKVQFIHDSGTYDCEVDESFWITKEYFDLATEYFKEQQKGSESDFSSESDSDSQ